MEVELEGVKFIEEAVGKYGYGVICINEEVILDVDEVIVEVFVDSFLMIDGI